MDIIIVIITIILIFILGRWLKISNERPVSPNDQIHDDQDISDKRPASPNDQMTHDDQDISNERLVPPNDQTKHDEQDISNERLVPPNDQTKHDEQEISSKMPVSPNDQMTHDEQDISNDRPVSPNDQTKHDEQEISNDMPVSPNDQTKHDEQEISSEMPVSPNDQMTHDGHEISNIRPVSCDDQMKHDEQEAPHKTDSQELCMSTDYQSHQSESETANIDDLSYDWAADEILQMAKAYRISSDEEGSDGYNSDDYMVPEPSISQINEGTSYAPSSKRTTTVDENYIMDDMSSLSNITDIQASNAPQKHEYAKERVEKNICDKLYNACLKGKVSMVKKILETHNGTLTPDEHGQTPLYAACLGNHLDIIKLLISFGYDVNHQDNEGKTPLHRTFEDHDPDLAKILIAELSASIEVRDAHNWTPLHTAIDQGYFNYSHDLTCTFFQGDVGTEVAWIQLHAACFEGRIQDVQVLLDANTDVNHVSSAGYTPLHIAVTKNNTHLVTLLMDQNVHVNSRNSRRQTPLHIAAENAYEAIIQELLIRKADPNLKDELGNTSLYVSVQMKQEKPRTQIKQGSSADTSDIKPYRACSIETVQAIIGHGADVNAMNNRYQTALWLACSDGQNELAKTLLHTGADPNIANKDGESSLHSAIYGYCNTNVLKEIIDHGAHVNAARNDGATALVLACSTAKSHLVTLLLKVGADPNIADADGDTSLQCAITAECSKGTLQEIIGYCAEVNARNKRGRTPLLLSCSYGQVDAVQVLLGAGADPSIVDEEGLSCLHAAIDGRCSRDTLQALIDHGACINATRKDGTNALLRACYTGQSESVKFLLEAGADVNIANRYHNTCLHHAVKGNCSKDTLKKIIEQGLNVNALNSKGETALIHACYQAQAESVKVLLETGADPNISDASGYSSLLAAIRGRCTNETLTKLIACKSDLDAQDKAGRTALCLACFYKQQEAVRILLDAGSNPNIADKYGHTCLFIAIKTACWKRTIRAIIDRGANVNATNIENCTALMMACGEKQEHAIHVLLKKGCDINVTDKIGDTCLMYAVGGLCSKKVLQAIIDQGADVNATNKNNHTTLMMACEKRHEDAIHVLLKAGSDTNIAEKNGDTCLMYAVTAHCSKEVLQAILDQGTDVNATNKHNYTALTLACENGNIDAIHVLLKKGSNTNVTDKNGDTCLMCVVAGHYSKEVLQEIIDQGADVNATNKNNRTALMMACEKKLEDAIHLLLKAGAETNISDIYGKTCLMYAIDRYCSKAVLQAIIDQGTDVNASNKHNPTALTLACTTNHEDAIHVLLKAGSDTNIGDIYGETCLMCAVHGHCSKEVLQAIIDQGADVNATNKSNHTALMLACMKSHEDAIHVLLKAGSESNISDIYGETCLVCAVRGHCSKEVLQAIIDQGTDVNASNEHNPTALMLACTTNHEDAIHVLLKAGSNTNIADIYGETCLVCAVRGHCSKEVLQAIIDLGTDVNVTNRNNHTALMMACQKNHEDAIHVLLKAGSDTNIAHNGYTCLMYAVSRHCSKEVLQAIIDHGADVNATDKYNRTALTLACKNGNIDAIHVLLKAGSDTNIPDKCVTTDVYVGYDLYIDLTDGGLSTCLMYAVDGYYSKAVLQAIIDQGADVNATNKNNQTALTLACKKNHEDAIHVLLKAGSDTNIADKNGDTCLMIAVIEHCSKEVLQAIIDQGADVNATNKNCRTALMMACKMSHEDAIHVLLKAGSETNISDIYGGTCLMYAVAGYCSKAVLQAIIDLGTDVNVTNKNNHTALMMACQKKHEDAIHVLLKAGSDTNIPDKYEGTNVYFRYEFDLYTGITDGNVSTCLMCAVDGYCSKEVLQAIIDQGADVNATNIGNQTALTLACMTNHEDAIHVLLKAGSDTNIADTYGGTCLMYAVVVKCCSKEVLQAIIDHGADVNATNENNRTALMMACRWRHEDAIHVLLKAGSDTNIADKYDLIDLYWTNHVCVQTDNPDSNVSTCLMYAVDKHCSKVVLQAIIDQGADVNATNKYSRTALMLACKENHEDAIHVLLKAGSDSNIADKNGDTCLMWAVSGYCSKRELHAIIHQSADVNATNKNNHTALMLACKKSHEDAIHVLLQAGSDTNIADKNGETWLMCAVDGHCSNNVLRAIIDQGANINARSKNNCTALMKACETKHEDAINMLLQVGADTIIADDDGTTCLMYAVKTDCSKEVLLAIIDHGADVNATNKHNRTVLIIACKERHEDAIHLLLKAGSDTNIADKNGDTCLMYAVDGHFSKEVLQAIIDQGADVNATNKYSRTALTLACKKRHEDAIHVLLQAGSDADISDKYDGTDIYFLHTFDRGINVPDGNVSTCLMYAVDGYCSKGVLQAIIDQGADVNATDNNNRTALMMACKENHEDAIHVLLKAVSDTYIADENGDTCLMYAVDGLCSKEVLQAIIDLGTDVNATNKNNHTALMMGCKKRHEDAIHVLLKAGSDTNIPDKHDGRDVNWGNIVYLCTDIPDGNVSTCLMYAVDGYCSKEVLQAIIDQGADVNATDKHNRTALIMACKKRREDAIHVLLKAGSDTYIADENGYTCLMYAVNGHCSKEVLQAIIDQGIDVNATNKDNHTAFTLACICSHLDAIHMLLKTSSDANIGDMYDKTWLMYAIDRYCSKEVVQTIVDQGADVNATDKNNCTALMLACKRKQEDAIHVLLKGGSDTNIADKNGDTCLMCAVYGHCSKKVLQAIIDQGADVNVTNKSNHTALLMACKMKHEDAIHVLLKAGSDTNIADKDGDTCLMCVVAGHYSKEVLQAIIDRGADVNATDKNNHTALMVACKKRCVVEIYVLLKAGSDTNIADENGDTCLMCAVAGHYRKEMLKAIIDRGADVNARTKDNCTALMKACDRKHEDAINILLKVGADINIADDDGTTCLMYAVDRDCSKEVLQAIIDHGGNVNTTDKENCTALMIACQNRYIDGIYVLLKAGADPNITDDIGWTCLMYAVDWGCNTDVLQSIIDHGAHVNATNLTNCTTLMIACAKGYMNVFNVLLKAGVDPNIKDKHRQTCLMYAVTGGCSKEVLQAIIDHGADVNATDNLDRTALIIAVEKSCVDVINTLLKAGADVNVTNNLNDTPLMMACRQRSIDVINLLLNAGSDATTADNNGVTCLMAAVDGDCSEEVLQTIIDHGADVNATDNLDRTALVIAVEKSCDYAINTLLKAGADASFTDYCNSWFLCIVNRSVASGGSRDLEDPPLNWRSSQTSPICSSESASRTPKGPQSTKETLAAGKAYEDIYYREIQEQAASKLTEPTE